MRAPSAATYSRPEVANAVAVHIGVAFHLLDGVAAGGDGVLFQFLQGGHDRLLQISA